MEQNEFSLLSSLGIKTKVYGFVGASGTGKSYRAQMVANAYNIKYIIDDGILIKGNDVLAGSSAKKASTKIETVKRAIFINEEQKKTMVKAIRKERPRSILILGTSEKMVCEIAENLKLPKISKIIHIEDVATKEEIADAKATRTQEGKHVIPVPTFEIKKEFSGYLLDPLQIFRKNGKMTDSGEKSIIRPTFNYIGNFTISDNVFKEIIDFVSKKFKAIQEIMLVTITKTQEGPSIYAEAKMNYGYNIITELNDFKQKCIFEIEKQTTMNVVNFKIVCKKIEIPEMK